jgi:DNA-binding SARP family transcriptional activator
MAKELQLLTLGDVEVRLDGAPLPALRSAKALALLAYLAVTGRPHLRPALAGLLWGELPEASAQNNLRKALSALRTAVGTHLTITRQSAALNRECPYWLDVEVFGAACSLGRPPPRSQSLPGRVRGLWANPH